ncbi:MAG: zeta toxin family protein [Actinomycetaceae bacterium]|nr:zeta toxin family protein [Actinomycetaceae bacterium]
MAVSNEEEKVDSRFLYKEEDLIKSFNQIKAEDLDFLEASRRPTFVLFGGQAGAGKSQTIGRVKEDNPSLYVIDVDELRERHPAYAEIQKEYGINASEYTHEFASRLKDKIVDYLREQGVDFGLETTMADEEKTLGLVQDPTWEHNGYHIEAYGVIVPREISEIGVVSRYFHGREEGNARYVPAHVRAEQYEGMAQTVRALAESGAVETIGLYDRDGKELYLAHGDQINPDRAFNTVAENRKLENTSTHQLETALENHAYNQSQNEHIQAQPAQTPAERNEQKILAADMKQELTYAKDIEKALPKARKKERQEKRDERLKKRVEENKDKGQSQNRDKVRDKDIQDRGRTR